MAGFGSVLAVLKDYQSLAGTLLAVGAGLVAAPWIGERYARSREYWTRRIDFAREVADFMLILRTTPDAEPNVLHTESPDFQTLMDRATQLRNQARVLYADGIHRNLFTLLLYSVLLRAESRVAFCNAIAQFLEEETHGEPKRVRLGQLVAVLRYHPELLAAVESSDLLAPPETGPSLPVVQGCFADLATAVTRTLRLWSVLRPWRWPLWLRWERDLRRAARPAPERLTSA
jgi:hypothetical protein